MKKIFTSIVCCMALFIFSGCAVLPFRGSKITENPKEITSIEVYYFGDPMYDNNGEWGEYSYQEGGSVYIPYEGGPIGSVKKEDYEEFITDYENLPYKPFIIVMMDPASWYRGYVVKVNTDEDYSLYAVGHGHSDELDRSAWEEFLKKYIGEEPFQIVEESKQSSEN